jgi:hypothetical protein
MHRLSGAAVALLAVACSPLVQPSRPAGIAPDPLTWKARAAFDAAVAVRDTARMASLFAPGAFVSAATGDTIPIRDAIPLYLSEVRNDPGTVQFSWGREGALESCVGGAREQLTYTVRLTRADGTSSGVLGKLSVFWTADSSGALKVAWIAFAKHERERRLTRSECPSVEAKAWRSWRWAVSVYPAPGLAVAGARSSFESVLRQRGWVDRECSCASFPPSRVTPISDGSFIVPPSLVSVQYHSQRHLVAEVVASLTPSGNTIGARFSPNRDYAHTRLWYSSAFVAALVSYERWGFQFGVGPVVQVSHWRMRDSVVPYSSGGLPSFQDTTWSTAPIGVVGDVRYNLLVSTRTFLTFRGQLRRFPSMKTPATPRFPEAAVNQGGSLLGLGVGVIF